MKNPTLRQVSNSLNNKQLKEIAKQKQNIVNTKFLHQIALITGYRPVMEYRFHPKRRWRIDFAIPELLIAIEVEGGRFKKTTFVDRNGKIHTHTGGRHNTAQGFKNDMEKYNELAAMGWLLVRTTPEELLSEQFLQIVLKCINTAIFLQKKLP